MQWKLICKRCHTHTNGIQCEVCGNQYHFDNYAAWSRLPEPLSNIAHLRELGWYVHFNTIDIVADRIHAHRPPQYSPWFAKANMHLWYSAGVWYCAKWENKQLTPLLEDKELYELLNQLGDGREPVKLYYLEE